MTKSKIFYFVITGCLVFGVFAWPVSGQTVTPGSTIRDSVKTKVDEQLAQIQKAVAKKAFLGEITVKSDAQLTLTTFSGQTRSVTVSLDTVIKLAGNKDGTPADLKVKKGREATFKVNPTGSVLSRTSIAINGKKGEITDIPEGKTVNVYWVPDASDPKTRFARKIDVILSDEELDAKYGVDKIEAD